MHRSYTQISCLAQTRRASSQAKVAPRPSASSLTSNAWSNPNPTSKWTTTPSRTTVAQPTSSKTLPNPPGPSSQPRFSDNGTRWSPAASKTPAPAPSSSKYTWSTGWAGTRDTNLEKTPSPSSSQNAASQTTPTSPTYSWDLPSAQPLAPRGPSMSTSSSNQAPSLSNGLRSLFTPPTNDNDQILEGFKAMRRESSQPLQTDEIQEASSKPKSIWSSPKDAKISDDLVPIQRDADDHVQHQRQSLHRKQKKEHESRSMFSAMERVSDLGEHAKDAHLHSKSKPKTLGRVKRTQVVRSLCVPSVVTVEHLAKLMGVRLEHLQKRMHAAGLTETAYDHVLGSDYAAVLAEEFGFNAIVDDEAAFDLYPPQPHPNPSSLPLRPPIVTIMGHVDHGKTTLLDYLRKSSVAKGEAGGITQHIGAFSVPVKTSTGSSVKSITFLDTPGHAAFTAMRARGARVTDIIVLVVAADDGVMPQTKEVLQLIKSDQESGHKLGVVVAINKVDKPEADVDYVQKELLGEGLDLEAFNGSIPSVNVSGLTGTGLPELVETLSTVAEIQELRAERDNSVPMVGYILEARTQKGLGAVATVLVLRGCLKPGDHLLAGTSHARVRAIVDSAKRSVQKAYPGDAVTVSGWKSLPTAGDEVLSGSESDIRKAITNRERQKSFHAMARDAEALNEARKKEREQRISDIALAAEAEERRVSRIRLQRQMAARETDDQDDGRKELPLIVKADVRGSEEAAVESLQAIGNAAASTKILNSGVGEVTESDVEMAKISEGAIVAFSVDTPRAIQALADKSGVPIISSPIIYRLLDEVRAQVAKLLPPIVETMVTAEITVIQLFDIKGKDKKAMKVAGCKVTNGAVSKTDLVWVIRRGETIHDGSLETLRILKENATEVRKGQECGLSITDFSDVQPGDVLKCYKRIEKPAIL